MASELTAMDAAVSPPIGLDAPAIPSGATAPAGDAVRVAPSPSSRWAGPLRFAGAFLVTMAAGFVLVVAFLAGLSTAYADRAFPNVSVAGVQVGGLDRAAAEARLRAQLPSLATGQIVVQDGSATRSIPFSRVGRDYDYAAMLDQAFGAGRAATPVDQMLDEVRVLTSGYTVAPRVTFDPAALQAAVAELAVEVGTQPTDAGIRRVADGSFTIVPSSAGRVLDQHALIAAAGRALSTTAAGDATLPISTIAVAPVIDDAAAAAARDAAVAMTSQPLTLTSGKQHFSFPAATLRTWVAFRATPNGGFEPTIETAAARAAVAKLAPKVAKAPTDAKYLTGDGKVVGVLASVDGQALDPDRTLGAIQAALATPGTPSTPPSVQLALMAVSPSLSTDAAKKTAPLMTMVGSWTTIYQPSEANYWGANISIPARTLDGYVVEPGAWFSFWDAIGEVSTAKGYGMGGAIIDGHTQEQGALAGGICSTSTTLFNAALRSGLQIGERSNHYYYISRYPVGLDATVSKSGSSEQNMTFRNDTPYPVLIHSITGTGVVTFQLYSVPSGRKVSLTTPIVQNYSYASDSTQYTTSIPAGSAQRVEFASNGFDAWVTRTVTDSTGKVIHRETYYSHYATVNGLLLVGVSPSDPRAPKTASPKPSASPSPSPTN